MGAIIMAIACFFGAILLSCFGEPLVGAMHFIAGSIFYLAYIIDRK